MKHLISAIFYIITILYCSSSKAQSFTELFVSSEQIKTQYGETDNRYLDVLSKVVSAALEEEKFEEANKFRTIHSEIIKSKYGEFSIEYAEDLWRLGNVSHFKGELYTSDCYRKAAKIYETLHAEREFPYCDLMWRLYSHYYNAQKWNIALYYLKKHIDYYELWIGQEWKGNSLTYVRYTELYLILGNFYRDSFHDIPSANEAYKKCVVFLEKNELVNGYKYSWMPYALLSVNYSEQQDYENAVIWQRKLTEVLAQTEGYDSDNYIQELSNLRYNYWHLNEFDSVKSISIILLLKIEQKYNKLGISVSKDTMYTKIQKELLSLCVISQDYRGVIKYAPTILKLYEQNGLEQTDDYLNTLDNLILAYHNLNDYISAYELYSKYEGLSKLLGKLFSDEYWSYLLCKTEALTALFKLDECSSSIEELKSLTSRLYEPNSQQTLLMMYLVANYQETIGLYEQASNSIEKCYRIINTKKCHFYNKSDSLLIIAGLHCLEGSIYMGADTEKAEEKLILSIEESNAIGVSAHNPLTNLGILYSQQKRNFKTAVSYFELARLSLEKIGDNYSVQYLTILNNLGFCYQNQGMESRAISIFDSVLQMVLVNYGKQHVIYGTTEQNKSVFYCSISNYSEAIKCCKEALVCYKHIFGEDSEKYALCLQNLGLMYQYAGDFSTSKDILLSAISILEQLNSPHCIAPYTNLLTIYAVEKDSTIIDDCIKPAVRILKDNHWEESDMAISLYGSIGYAMLINGMSDAKSYFSHALDLFDKTKGAPSSQYHYGLLLLGMSAFLDQSQSEDIIPLLTESYKNLYLNDAVFFNNSEREALISGSRLSQTKNVLFSSRKEEKQDTHLYNFLLFNKGLLLGTTINYAKSVYDVGNEEIANKYKRLLNLNQFLNGETKYCDIELSLDEAKFQASILEREITTYLKQARNYTTNLNYTYSDVLACIKSNDLAIEFVSFFNYTDNTTYYAAMLVRSGWSQPRFIKLCSKNDLERLVPLSPDKLYGESIISENAYNLIWKPLAPYLTNIKTIYFSPAGYINKLAIEYLYNGEKHFNEMYNVVRVTSTREICKNKSKQKYISAILYGGLTYDEDDATLIKESERNRKTVTIQPDTFKGFTNSSVTRKGWTYLPGTLDEVNKISSIISKSKINCNVYTAEQGNEESFKALSGTKFDILHIATHGFYMTSSQAEQNEFFLSNPFGSQNIISGVSPLQRTGLLLSGGNKAWKGEAIPRHVEDGILTAAEITSLNLSSCDIVVLSACETGLGEITDEGVFGLQRAFKNAGVTTIVMSLWEVDDQATSLMMQTFYHNLLRNKSKYEAFSIAQKKVREKYADPRYWAAFVMLD